MTIPRRRVLATLGVLSAAACGVPPARTSIVKEAPSPLFVDPLVDLVAIARLAWLVQLRPRDLTSQPTFARAIATLIPAWRFDALAEHHGGVDIRRAGELVVAGYPETTLVLARVGVDGPRVERAFSERAAAVDGRSVERSVTRVWGAAGGTHSQLAVFGREAVGIERGQPGPLSAAVYFAEKRLKRSAPALRAEPLAAAAEAIGDAPIRAFAPDPFAERWGAGLGGLLSAATAAGASLQASSSRDNTFVARFVLTGSWGNAAAAAAERFGAAFDLFANDPLGRLTGLDRPATPCHVQADSNALKLEVGLDAEALARGLAAVTTGTLADILAL
jgi:hypothetical protein